jgi:hypothetical protein
VDELQLRVGDGERRAVDERLQAAVGDGRLTLHEYDERAALVWAARTRAELEATTADLPAPVAPVPPPAPAPAPRGRGLRPRRAVAVMSGDRLTGPVAPGQGVQAYAVMGGAVVDLQREQLPPELTVTAVAVMGGVEVLVPRGVAVQLSGFAFMGGRDVRTEPPPAGAPVVRVQAYALMGGVEVKHGQERPAGPQPVSLHKDLASAVQAHGSQLVPQNQNQNQHRPRHRLRHRVVAGVAVAAVAFGLSGVVGADNAAVFGSREVRVAAGQSVDVANLFGSVTVIVPDDVPVTSDGTVIFGSTECDACDTALPGGPASAHVHSRGAFGSIEIVTESEFRSGPRDRGRDD